VRPRYQQPVIAISPAGGIVCKSEIVTLTASGAGNYTWMPGNVPDSVLIFTATTPGQFTITGIGAGGCMSSGVASYAPVDCTTIAENSASVKFKILPNPFSSSLEIHCLTGSKASYKIEVLNIDGGKILEMNVVFQKNNCRQVPLEEVAAGIYIVRISLGSSENVIFRIVKI
jgi:hypothetical protein